MSMEAACVCPKCGHEGPHPMLWYETEGRQMLAIRLHCNRCEHVWTEDMVNG